MRRGGIFGLDVLRAGLLSRFPTASRDYREERGGKRNEIKTKPLFHDAEDKNANWERENEEECAAYLEESRESRFRLTSRFYRLPRGLPIIKEEGVRLQDDWLGELQKRRIMNNKQRHGLTSISD